MRVSAVLVVLLLGLQGCGGGSSTPAQDPAPPVSAAPPIVSAPVVTPPVTTPPVVTPPVVTPPVAPPVVKDPLANLKQGIRDAGNNVPATITVVGFGSSVGVGATLPDPTTQAPVMYFGQQLKALYGKTGALSVTTYNRSVNGSVVSQMINDSPRPAGYWQSFADEGKKAQLVIFAYGMNDGFPGAFNTGQTFPFVYTRLVESIKLAQAAGAEVIVMTTPHPISTVDWAMPAGVPQIYPTFLNPDVGPEQMTPAASKSTVLKDMLGHGILIPVSERHLQVNEAMRKAAVDTGAVLLDVEPMWFEAVEARGTDKALFNVGQTVHPNLLGHQVSYQRAIDAFLAKLVPQ